MTPEPEPTVDPPPEPAPPTPPTADPTPPPTPATPPSEPTAPAISAADLDAAREKARSDEKSKLYPQIETAKAAATEATEKSEALEQELAKTQKQLSDLRAGNSDAMASVNAQIEALEAKNKKTEQAMENLATEAALRVRSSELATYRQTKISAAGLANFAELVSGDTEEAIDTSVAAAKVKEDKAKEDALAAARKELGAAVPTPLAASTGGSGNPPVVNANDRDRIARLKGPEYQAARAELMQKAKEEAGLI